MDFQALLYNPQYLVLAVDATLIVKGQTYSVRAIDKTSGIDTGVEVRGQTILPACTIRAADFLTTGAKLTDLGEKNNSILLNGIWWNIVTYRLKPSPKGERDGEVYLLLTKAPIIQLDEFILPPRELLDDTALSVYLSVYWDFGILDMPQDPDFADDAGLDAMLTITTLLNAAIADDNGLTAPLSVVDLLSADIVDDNGLDATIQIGNEFIANISDDGGIEAAQVDVTTLLDANIADDNGISFALLSAPNGIEVITLLSAIITDDVGLTAQLLATTSLTAVVQDDLGISTASLTIASDPLTVEFKQTNSAANGSTQTTTLSSVNIGAADPNRFVVIAFVLANFSQTGKANSITIGGIAATIVAQQPTSSGFNNFTGFAYAKVPTGTTANIVFSQNDFQNVQIAAVYRVISPTGNVTVVASDKYRSGSPNDRSIATADAGAVFWIGSADGTASGDWATLGSSNSGMTVDNSGTSYGAASAGCHVAAGHYSNTAAGTISIHNTSVHPCSISILSLRP